ASQPQLPGTSLPDTTSTRSKRDKRSGRCAICVNSYCFKRHECPGKGNRLCRCGHPPLTKKPRISEAQI
ncbi:hypothetical protein R3P38DRAFT_2455739, partial [Favolaschia claudopus]